jgi:hypothetical protein
MFVKLRKKSQLDVEIETKLDELRAVVRDDEKYDAILAKLERLYKIKEKEKPYRVSADTWALIGANILGIVIIITHEYTNPITTKAMNFTIKPR